MFRLYVKNTLKSTYTELSDAVRDYNFFCILHDEPRLVVVLPDGTEEDWYLDRAQALRH